MSYPPPPRQGLLIPDVAVSPARPVELLRDPNDRILWDLVHDEPELLSHVVLGEAFDLSPGPGGPSPHRSEGCRREVLLAYLLPAPLREGCALRKSCRVLPSP